MGLGVLALTSDAGREFGVADAALLAFLGEDFGDDFDDELVSDALGDKALAEELSVGDMKFLDSVPAAALGLTAVLPRGSGGTCGLGDATVTARFCSRSNARRCVAEV